MFPVALEARVDGLRLGILHSIKYSYTEGLLDFSRRSNEKVILAEKVGTIIRKNKVSSLLDVGAGDGTFASMIAGQVPQYLAVEKRTEHVALLRKRGLHVSDAAEFPLELGEKFDMVLSAHCVPSDKVGIEKFSEQLVAAAKENGIVCVITYRTDKDSWYVLMRDVLEENWHGKNLDTYNILLDVLMQYGHVTIEKVDATVRGKTAEDLFSAFRFLYAGKDVALADRFDAHRDKVLEWIEKACRVERGYEFPSFQYVITSKKVVVHRKYNLHA